MSQVPELNVAPDEARRMGPVERREYALLHMLDVRRDIRQVFKGALIGIVVNSLWQALADWLFPSGSSYVILFWIATLFVILILFNRWNAYDENQRYKHLSKFESERSRRQAQEIDPHSAERTKILSRNTTGSD